jgi:hypothetical protein
MRFRKNSIFKEQKMRMDYDGKQFYVRDRKDQNSHIIFLATSMNGIAWLSTNLRKLPTLGCLDLGPESHFENTMTKNLIFQFNQYSKPLIKCVAFDLSHHIYICEINDAILIHCLGLLDGLLCSENPGHQYFQPDLLSPAKIILSKNEILPTQA